MIATIDDWTMALERGEQVDVAYCDFSKAFDKVDHNLLIYKLLKLGVNKTTSWTINKEDDCHTLKNDKLAKMGTKLVNGVKA